MYSKSNSDYINYTRIRTMTRTLCATFEHQLVNDVKDNPKAFWKYARSKTKTKSGISDLRKDNGSLTSTDLEKAEVLNRFFISVFTQENTETMPIYRSLGPVMFVIYINDLPTSVKHALVRIFADDTKMYKEVPSYAVHSEVQSDLNELENWSDRWQIGFNKGTICRLSNCDGQSTDVKQNRLKFYCIQPN